MTIRLHEPETHDWHPHDDFDDERRGIDNLIHQPVVHPEWPLPMCSAPGHRESVWAIRARPTEPEAPRFTVYKVPRSTLSRGE